MPEEISPEKTDIKVITRIVENIGIITMNDRKRANCLSFELIEGILNAFTDFQEKKVRVIIIRAYPGTKVWSAGHDVKEIPVDGQDPLHCNVPFERLLRQVRSFPAPIIGMIEGGVWGGACDLAMTCDMLVGAPNATFAITPAKMGIPYNIAGLTHFIGVLPLHIIKQMLFTAMPLPAEDALKYGMLNKIAAPEVLEETTMEYARQIASLAPLVIQALKFELEKLTAGPGLVPDDSEYIQGLRRKAYRSSDFKEGITAFFEKRKPEFKGE